MIWSSPKKIVIMINTICKHARRKKIAKLRFLQPVRFVHYTYVRNLMEVINFLRIPGADKYIAS